MPAKSETVYIQVMDVADPIKFTSDDPTLTVEMDMGNGILRIIKSGVICGEFNRATLVGWWYA